MKIMNNVAHILSLSLIIVFSIHSQSAMSSTLVVTSNGNDGPGTFREAVELAESGDTIMFEVTGLINLYWSEGVLIDKDLHIKGPRDAYVDLAHEVWSDGRVLAIKNATVLISDLTISGGFLQYYDPSNPGESAGAGLHNDNGRVTLNRVAFNWNDAYEGAAIYNDGYMRIMNSNISGNFMFTPQKGSCDDGGYGAISNAGFLRIINTTIVANSSGRGSDCIQGIYQNDPDAHTSLVNTLIGAGSPTSLSCLILDGTIESLGHNMAALYGPLSVDGNACQLDQDSDVLVDYSLFDSEDYPLPKDPHHLGDTGVSAWGELLPGSLAIDAGNTNIAPPVDINGTIRPQGIAADIGSFEFVPE